MSEIPVVLPQNGHEDEHILNRETQDDEYLANQRAARLALAEKMMCDKEIHPPPGTERDRKPDLMQDVGNHSK